MEILLRRINESIEMSDHIPEKTTNTAILDGAGKQERYSLAHPTGRPPAFRVLLLGGTSEAWDLAALLAGRKDVIIISSLAGRVHQPRVPKGLVRIGGFGGVDGLIDYLQAEKIDAVIDATHPFAVRISRNAEAACRELGIPLIAFGRTAWTATENDDWYEVKDFHAAAEYVDRTQSRIFLSIGRQELAAFAGCAQSNFIIRAIEEPPPPLPLNHFLILQRGPFELDDEVNLLRKYSIDLVVSKNSGGTSTYAKILAARQLRIPVVMITRPVKHAVQALTSVEEVSTELQRLINDRFPLLTDGMEAGK
jgi:precorrin-6A/cobalt-precorrin-6A reductase